MFSHINIIISIKVREKNLLKDRDYFFKLKTFNDLNLNDDFLTHVINVNIMIV